jgi:hypothetical protein
MIYGLSGAGWFRASGNWARAVHLDEQARKWRIAMNSNG